MAQNIKANKQVNQWFNKGGVGEMTNEE